MAAVGQHLRSAQLQRELAAVLPENQAAATQNDLLGRLQSQLSLAQADAELSTYLRHRWPRTQIIAALTALLPEEITFDQLEIRRESSGRSSLEQFSRNEREAEEVKLAAMPPAARDLENLRVQCDHNHTVVTLVGAATDGAALHRYLGDLDRLDMFDEVDFSIETDRSGPNASLRFTATVTVRPGYGQPGGPIGDRPEEPAQNEIVNNL